ncbi:hypothetical protein Pcar_3366 [Syntrophotalea carbinolica DSM 2380]|uniref:Uncharacterized protein n=1 Tax=Syntrophotalea carbinolica (strain DSM 2380 / NBRC 103641 / GraBd1) TaxID=338963 RepID=Q0C6F7_SYNC1|nr:hypothetical protein Pcar_3366 [Syntrophotalea carbinolica DSM 2380]
MRMKEHAELLKVYAWNDGLMGGRAFLRVDSRPGQRARRLWFDSGVGLFPSDG